MPPDLIISVQENTDVASARRIAAGVASKAGFGEEDAGALAVIVTEVATNLVKHGGGGDLIVRDVSQGASPLVEIIGLDRGRGMSSVARCFEDGYSTGSSPGTGLGAISRLARFHDVYSISEKGTVLLAQTGARNVRQPDLLQIGALNIPYPGEEICGDAWTCHSITERTRFVVADGLGHGVFAAVASNAAIESVGDAKYFQPQDVIEAGHRRLKATRGAAIAVVDLYLAAGKAIFAGVGNVCGAVVSPAGVKRQMVSINGTLGHEMGKVREYTYPFEPGSLLVMHSDGLSANWSLDKYPGLFHRHPSVIAGVLFRDFRRIRDDATVVVARAIEASA